MPDTDSLWALGKCIFQEANSRQERTRSQGPREGAVGLDGAHREEAPPGGRGPAGKGTGRAVVFAMAVSSLSSSPWASHRVLGSLRTPGAGWALSRPLHCSTPAAPERLMWGPGTLGDTMGGHQATYWAVPSCCASSPCAHCCGHPAADPLPHDPLPSNPFPPFPLTPSRGLPSLWFPPHDPPRRQASGSQAFITVLRRLGEPMPTGYAHRMQ